MASVDERIVSISFENSKFEANVASTMRSLGELNKSIGNVGKENGLESLEASSRRVNFSGVTHAIDGISSHLSAVQTAASVAFGNIAAVAIQKLGSIAKTFSLDPVIAGFHNYETQINAIQTIQANTGLQGKSGLAQVSAALQNLNKYANLTVYNFSQMAQNIGTFTAAGVKLQPATESIKGIANLAALSGSSSEQASSAMYQLSQAIAAGQVHLQDWNSVVNAGIGGSVFQKALIRTGQALGTIKDGAVSVDKATGRATINGQTFRQSLQQKPGEKSWLTSDVLVKTLTQFTGDLSTAQLKAQGFNDAQIKAIESTAKTARNAATQIKTFSQLTQALKEEVGSAWANVFTVLFGNINQAKTLFSGLHNFMEKALTGPILNFAQTLREWAALGGRTDLLAGLKSGFKDLSDILKPIHEAFREVFPPSTAKDLLTLTENFKNLMDNLRPSAKTIDEIQRTFAGLFSLLHIGWDIIKVVAKAIGGLFSAAAPAAGGILGLTANFGDFLTKLDRFVSGKAGADSVFKGLEGAVKGPLKLVKELASAIKNLFTGGISGGALGKSVSGLGKSLGPLSGLLKEANKAWQGFLGIVDQIKTAISPTIDKIADVIGHFADIVENGIKNADYSKVFAAINTVLIAGIFLTIKKAIGGGVSVDFGQGLLKKLSAAFEGLTGSLKSMQKNLQAATLLEIAAAIGVLAAGILLLSTINPQKLGKAMTAVAVGMGELVGAMKLMTTGLGKTGFIEAPIIASSLVILATALVILAGAMKIFATMSWQDLAKGLTGVGASLAVVAGATRLMDGKKLLVTAAALLPLSIAINILAVAVKIFATMSWQQIARGLTGLAGSLGIIALAMRQMPPNMIGIGAGLIIVGAGLTALAVAIAAFGHMSFITVGKGILSIGAALVVIGAALDTFPPTLGLQAASLILVAAGLTTLAVAIGVMGSMQVGTLIKGILAMGAALFVLGAGLNFMEATLPGSAALLVAAAAFDLLAPAMAALGILPWGVILKALGAMALTIGILAVVGALASGPLTALGIAIAILGVGLIAIGGAVYLAAKGISLLSDTSTKAVGVLIASITAFIVAFPAMVIQFIKGVVDILQEVVKLAPKIITALVSIINQLLDAFPKILPKLTLAIEDLLESILKILDKDSGPLIDAGWKLLLNLLTGIAKNIGKVTDTVATIIATFLGSLAKDAPKIIAGGVQLIVAWLSGITKNISKIVGVVGKLIVTFLNAVSKNLNRIVASGGNLVASFINAIAKQVPKLIRAGTNLIVNFIKGVANADKRIINAAVNAAITFVNALSRGSVRLVNAGFNAIINFLNGIAKAIRQNSKRLSDAGYNVASAIVDGMINGLGNLGGKLLDKVKDLAGKAVHLFTHPWEAFSPSRVTTELGNNIMLGLILGLEQKSQAANDSIALTASNMKRTAKTAFGKIPGALDGIDNQPVIKPILDLSNVKKNAATLNGLMPSPVITAKISTDQAVKISDQQAASSTAQAGQAGQAPITHVNFEQNNYSPDPLPAIEIYRQTNNQLARVKSMIGAGPNV